MTTAPRTEDKERDVSERCGSCRYFEDATCFVLPPIRLPRKFASAGDRTRDETLIWGRPPVNAADLACEKFRTTAPRTEDKE